MDYESIVRKAVVGATSADDAERRIRRTLTSALVWVQPMFSGRLFSVLFLPYPGASNVSIVCQP